MLDVREAAGVVTLTLARPTRGNALDPALVDALDDAVAIACARHDAHTLVLHGAGDHFCTGFDLSDAHATSDGDLLLRFVRIEQMLARLYAAPLRTVAYARGHAFGAGADLFAACQVRVAHDSASFRFPGARFGLVLGTRRLAQRIGADLTRRIVTEGTTLDAANAVASELATARTGLDVADWTSTLAPLVVDRPTLTALNSAVNADEQDRDLATLVRSAAQRGLGERMAAYFSTREGRRGPAFVNGEVR